MSRRFARIVAALVAVVLSTQVLMMVAGLDVLGLAAPAPLGSGPAGGASVLLSSGGRAEPESPSAASATASAAGGAAAGKADEQEEAPKASAGQGRNRGTSIGRWTPSRPAVSAEDRTLMARAVYGEARGEPYAGQVAVAAVILNRLADPRFPNTVPGVIFETDAFTAVNDGQLWLSPNRTAYQAVDDALAGWDPTGGAVYYFNPDTATSGWIWTRPVITQIGRHLFAR